MIKQITEIDKKIMSLYNMGMGTRAIAAEVGKSKNSICGLLTRYRSWGFEVRKGAVKKQVTASVPKAPKPIKQILKPRAQRKHPFQMKFSFIDPKPLIHAEEIVNPVGKNLRFEQLKRTSCRYVVNSGRPENFLFCGEPIDRGAYCEHHANICYIPNEKLFKKTV